MISKDTKKDTPVYLIYKGEVLKETLSFIFMINVNNNYVYRANIDNRCISEQKLEHLFYTKEELLEYITNELQKLD